MINKEKNRSCSFWIDRTLIDLFQRTYPTLMSKFLVKCIRLAVKDRTFFDKVFFDL